MIHGSRNIFIRIIEFGTLFDILFSLGLQFIIFKMIDRASTFEVSIVSHLALLSVGYKHSSTLRVNKLFILSSGLPLG